MQAGAQFNEAGLPASYGNDQAALEAARAGAALVDRTRWGLIQVSDSDRLRFLHNQSTNAFEQRQPGEGCGTVFVTSTARTLDLTTAYITEDAVLLLTSPGLAEKLIEWMDRYIFFADKVKLTNLTTTTAKCSLIGPEAKAVLAQLGMDAPLEGPEGSHQLMQLDGLEVRVAVGSGVALPGYTLILAAEAAASLWERLVTAGAAPMGETPWQQLMLQQGRPLPGSELTDDYNPLEAGLWHMISFEKGCYIGQETIARLNTYQGVKQQLLGLKLSAPAAPGTPITVGDSKVGILTRLMETSEGMIGLGYIRTKAGGVGLEVTVGEAQGTVVDLPFASRGYLAQTAISS